MPGKEGVGEGVADASDSEIVDGGLVAELIHRFHHSATLLGIDGEPGEGGGHGVYGALRG